MVDLGGLVHLSVAETRHLSATADTRLSTRPRYVLVQESVEKLQPLEGTVARRGDEMRPPGIANAMASRRETRIWREDPVIRHSERPVSPALGATMFVCFLEGTLFSVYITSLYSYDDYYGQRNDSIRQSFS